MKEKTRTLAYFCPECRQPVIAERTVFSLCASHSEIKCPCGKSALKLDPGEGEITLTVPCAFCKTEHRVTVPERALLDRNAIALSCPASGLDSCYVGEEEPVFAAMRRLEEAMDQVDEPKPEAEAQEEEKPQFLNPLVMQEVLGELKDIAARGGVSCQCGSHVWSLKIHYSAVELICGRCGGVLRIPAATQSDITDICCKQTLTIHAAD